MRSHFFKLFFFLLAIYLPWIAVIKFGREYYLSDDFASWQYKFNKADEPKELFNPKHVAVGDCLLLIGVEPKKIDPDFYNLGMSGATPIDTYFLLKRYLDSGKSPQRVYLVFGLTHYQHSETFQESTIGYRLLNFREQLELFNDMRTYGSPESERPSWQKTVLRSGLTMMGLSSEIQSQVKHRLFASSYGKIHEFYQIMEESRGHHWVGDEPEQTFMPSPFVDFEKLSLNPLLHHYLKKTLNLLRERKIEAVIEFSPYNEITWEKFSPTLHREWQEFRKELKKEYPEVIIGDHLSYPRHLFSDHTHLNSRGSGKFSEELRQKYYPSLDGSKTAGK